MATTQEQRFTFMESQAAHIEPEARHDPAWVYSVSEVGWNK